MNSISMFSSEDANLLIRLLLAHLLGDFVLQTKRMVEDKRWLSKYMFIHIGIIYLGTAILTGWWLASGVIALVHYIIDGSKIEAIKRNLSSGISLFLLDQILHILTLIIVWAFCYDLWQPVLDILLLPLLDFNISLILLGYIVVIGPLNYIIQFSTQNMTRSDAVDGSTEHSGKQIGIFERIIILTLVLLGKFEAIGLLLIGKSLLRMSSKNDSIRNEYVLVGTMISYAASITIGVLINWLLRF